jgi:hypothetical protein
MERSAIRDSNAEQSGPGFRFASSGLQGFNKQNNGASGGAPFLFGGVVMAWIGPRFVEHQR